MNINADLARAVENAARAQEDLKRAIILGRKSGLSLRRLAELTGVSHETIRRWVDADN